MSVIKRGGVWYVKWKDGSDTWVRQRTAARSKAEAKVLAAELRVQADRQRKNLEALPVDMGHTVWDLCDWWLKNHCSAASLRRTRSQLDLHVRRSRLGAVKVTRARPELFEPYLETMRADGYAPGTINGLRRSLMGVFTVAGKKGLWGGANPLLRTTHLENVRPPRPVLKRDEVEPILGAVPKQWRGFFACAVYLGLRKGELCGTLKSDYDAARRTLYVGRSYRATRTKGKRVDFLPVSAVLAPFLDEARLTPGPYLFPGPNGRMRDEEAAPEEILRVAFKRLGWVEGWLHKCRRCTRGLSTLERARFKHLEASDAEPRYCAKTSCGFKLWPVGIPRAMRFHDLRHTAATHLLQAGVPVQHVQRILRHSSITTTIGTYGHLLTEDLRASVDKLGPPTVLGLPPTQLASAK